MSGFRGRGLGRFYKPNLRNPWSRGALNAGSRNFIGPFLGPSDGEMGVAQNDDHSHPHLPTIPIIPDVCGFRQLSNGPL